MRLPPGAGSADERAKMNDPAIVRAAQRGDLLAMNTLLDALTPYVGRF